MAKLNETDRKVMKKHGMRKMVKLFTKTYNKLCRACQIKTMENPREIYTNACEKCKPKLDILGGQFQ